eukprot:scaffold20705_cov127-Isochrysis_galbana.AAC.2
MMTRKSNNKKTCSALECPACPVHRLELGCSAGCRVRMTLHSAQALCRVYHRVNTGCLPQVPPSPGPPKETLPLPPHHLPPDHLPPHRLAPHPQACLSRLPPVSARRAPYSMPRARAEALASGQTKPAVRRAGPGGAPGSRSGGQLYLS